MARNQGGDWLRYENPDEKLPWLEPAGEFDRPASPLRGKLIGGLVAIVAVIALLVGGMTWFLNRDIRPGAGEPGLIKAPTTPYKVPPSDPGGMIVEGQGDTVYAAGQGQDPGGTIDLTAIPEEPVARGPGAEAGDVAIAALPPSTAAKPGTPSAAPKPSATVAVPAPKPAPAPAATPKPAQSAAPAATGGNYALQLGAFSTRANAESAWKSISGRFTFIGALGKSIEPVGKGDTTLYRLRATGIAGKQAADNLCGRMKVSGDSCTVIAP